MSPTKRECGKGLRIPSPVIRQAGERIRSHDPFELPVSEIDVGRAFVARQSGKPAEQQRVRGQVTVCALPPKLFAHRVEVPVGQTAGKGPVMLGRTTRK